jgi:plasmid maintenance system antidote protein VapI
MTYLEITAERAAAVGAERLAELTGIKQRRISMFINSPTKVTAGNAEKIKRALDKLDETNGSPE